MAKLKKQRGPALISTPQKAEMSLNIYRDSIQGA